jgi:hypothetical protein
MGRGAASKIKKKFAKHERSCGMALVLIEIRLRGA